MYRIIQFLFDHRAFFVFIILELASVILIFQNNAYQRAGFLNSSNRVVANILSTSDYISDFFTLKEANIKLADENARLREQLGYSQGEKESDISRRYNGSDVSKTIYTYIEADVVNNSTRFSNNFITINKGSEEGIEAGMSVIGSKGIVGSVKAVSDNFAVIYSVLHSDMMISSMLESTGDICTVKWDGRDPLRASVLYIPRHLNLVKGEKIVTSGFNAVFPPKISIGTIENIALRDDSPFYDVTINLATEFNKLSHVYVIQHRLRQERDSLEQIIRSE